METKPTQETSPTANMQSARMALTAARQVIMDVAETMEHGATRRGMMMARSQIGMMLDEMALKKEPTDTIVDLLIALSLPQKANDLESAKKRLAEVMAVACPACGTPMGVNPEDGKLGCPHVACCNIGGQNTDERLTATTARDFAKRILAETIFTNVKATKGMGGYEINIDGGAAAAYGRTIKFTETAEDIIRIFAK